MNDGAGKNTTFNMNRIINSAQDRAGNDVSVDFTINAGDGDDTLFAYDSEITFNGEGERTPFPIPVSVQITWLAG
ncbi:hypothetical protein [Aliamphritea spongicola]|nr:hypothetical protein [Aliamphritea spongicola]